jgi:hypothetical protein
MGQLNTNGAEQEQDTQKELLYVVNPRWYDDRKVSLAHLARARRCLECGESGYAMPAKRGSGKRAGGSRHIGAWKLEMTAIGDCCSKKTGYITLQTSILEAIFRLLLQNDNQPSTAPELYDGISKWWAGLEYLRDLNLLAIRRLLALQGTYGVTAVSSR